MRSGRKQLWDGLQVLAWLVCMGAPVWWASPVAATETADVYVSGYGIGSFVEDRAVHVASQHGLTTNIRSGAGLGLRVGMFPEITGRMVGLEIEYFGAFQRMSFVFPSNGQIAQGSAGLAVTNSMANLVVRWPRGSVRPYAGAGIGHSSGMLHNPTIPGRNTGDWDSTASFAYQLTAGLQADLTERVFAFVEYKRLAANYHWNGFAFDLRANYLALGFGLMF